MGKFRRNRKIHRKIVADAEVIYRKMQSDGDIVIVRLPRKKPDISKLVPFIKVLSSWN